MRELLKTLIVLSFLFAVVYWILKVLTGETLHAWLVYGPVGLGIVLILLMNWIFPEKRNTWISGKHDEEP